MPQSETVDVDPNIQVLPPEREYSVNPIKFNIGTTLQSPFFWLIVGIGVGVWLCKSNKI